MVLALAALADASVMEGAAVSTGVVGATPFEGVGDSGVVAVAAVLSGLVLAELVLVLLQLTSSSRLAPTTPAFLHLWLRFGCCVFTATSFLECQRIVDGLQRRSCARCRN